MAYRGTPAKTSIVHHTESEREVFEVYFDEDKTPELTITTTTSVYGGKQRLNYTTLKPKSEVFLDVEHVLKELATYACRLSPEKDWARFQIQIIVEAMRRLDSTMASRPSKFERDQREKVAGLERRLATLKGETI